MNKLLKCILLSLFLSGLAVDAGAYVIDGIDYLGFGYDGTVKVSRDQPTEAADIVIPEKVFHPGLGKEYTVTALEWGCFEGKTKLKSIKLPETITKIGGHSFYGCISLTDINIPNSVVEIGANCFSNCSSLTSIELPDSLEVIESYAFSGCTGLTEIIVPDRVKKIDYCAFVDCSSLISVVIGESVETIGAHAFYKANSITSVWLKPILPPVVDGDFYLTDNAIVYVPKYGFGYYSKPIWKDCNLKTYSSNEFNEEVSYEGLYYKYDKDSESYFVMAQNEDESINYQSLTDVVIPGKIIVGGSAFNVRGVMENAFAGSRLASITFPSTLETISAGAFRNCKELTTVKLSGNISNIGNEAFAGCDNITTIDSSNPVPPVLGTDVFPMSVYNNVNLSIPENNEEAYRNADGWKFFYSLLSDIYEIKSGDLYYRLNSKELTGEVIPESIIGSNYENLSDGYKVEIPASLSYKGHEFKITAIADGAFRDSRIYELVIPATITEIGGGAFDYSEVEYVDVPSLEYWYRMFPENNRPFLTNPGTLQINGESLTSVVITSDPVVPAYAFTGCMGITSLEIGEGITEFRTAYSGMGNVTTLILDKNVESVSATVINKMDNLQVIECRNMSVPDVLDGDFSYKIYRFATLYIPAIGARQYVSSSVWKGFADMRFKNVELSEYPDFIFSADSFGYLYLRPASREISGDIVIPSSIIVDGKTYDYSRVSDFADCSRITSISLPSQLTKFGNQTGYSPIRGCTSLKKIILPTSGEGDDFNPISYFSYLFSRDYSSSIFIDNPDIDLYIGSELLRDLEIPATQGVISSAFRGYRQLRSVTIPGSVTGVGDQAFSDCKNLVSMVILGSSSGTLTFGTDAIKGTNITNLYVDREISGVQFPKLESLEFGDNMKSIEMRVFTNTGTLKSITLPSSITEIGPDAFSGCTSLSEINFAGNGESLVIGSQAFKGCGSLRAVNFPAWLSSIGSSAFAGCKSLSEINFAEDGKELAIDEYAFDGCTSLGSVTFPASVSNIGYRAFADCTSLSEIHFAEDGQDLNISPRAFNGCTSLGSVTFPARISHIGSIAFSDCSSLSEIHFAEDGKDLVIDYLAFNGCSSLGSVAFPARISSIGYKAFTGCTSLSEIHFAEGSQDLVIGYEAFEGCTRLGSVSFPARIKSIGSSAFSGCTSLSEIHFAEDGKDLVIDSQAFNGCSSLGSVTFPAYLSNIAYSAFAGCASLSEIKFSERGTGVKIGGNAFQGTAIKRLEIPETVLSIGFGAFSNCGELSDVNIVSGTTELELGSGVFAKCPLKSLYYGRPSTVTSGYDVYPFSDTSESFDLTVEAKVGPNLFRNAKLKNVTFGKDISEIGRMAFYGCSALGTLVIPTSVETIGASAFEGCDNLSDIIFEDSQSKLVLGEKAFSFSKIENLYLGRVIEADYNTNGYGGVFSNNPNLKSVELGRYVTEISNYEFLNCPNLYSLTVGVGVRDIEQYAIGCVYTSSGNLTSSFDPRNFVPNQIAKVIWLPNTRPQGYEYIRGSVNYVSQSSYNLESQKEYRNLSSKFSVNGVMYVFNQQAANRTCVAIDCKYSPFMSETSVPNEVEYEGVKIRVQEINEYTFYNNSYIEKAEIGNNITEIGDYAFYGCEKLGSIFVPNSVKILGEWAFANCGRLESAIVGTALSEIRTGCFSGDKSLREFMVPSGVTMIANRVFDGCKGLKRFEVMNRNTDLYLGYSEKSVDTSDNPVAGKPLFVDAELEEVYIGGNISYSKTVEDGYSPFYRNDFLKKVTISDKETEVSDYEFYGCRNLSEVFVGNDVDRIGDYAFSGCIELKEFSLGRKVANIGVDAFSDCGNMMKLTSCNSVPPVCGSQALDDINVFKCTLYVPSLSVESYKIAEQWKNFYKIEPITAVAVPVTSVSFDYSTLSMIQGEQQQIVATVAPADASVPTLAWESDNVDVAMVSQFGNIVAIAPGSCYITATTTDGTNISETCFVTVTSLTGIFDVEISDIKVIHNGDFINVTGISENDRITVIDFAGNVVYDGVNKPIERLSKGLYIIVVRDKVFKIMI